VEVIKVATQKETLVALQKVEEKLQQVAVVFSVQ
jgi:hypothetical protein